MLSVDQITSLDLEISSYCVASCPMCPRNFFGMKYNAGYPVTNISQKNFQKIFGKKIVNRLEFVRINGNFGDFNMNPEAAQIVEYLREHNKNMDIEIHTNGHSRDTDFWRRLANSNPTVHFDLDGLEDTHHLHRVGTSFSRVIKNAKAFIDAGGQAVWKMIVFDHNEHQVSECRKLARELGFVHFSVDNDGRNDAFVFNKDGSYSHTIGTPSHIKPTDAHELMKWKKQHDWSSEVKVKKRIDCQAIRDRRIFMSSNGDIFPCCWLGFAPMKYDEHLHHGNSQLKKLMGDVNNNAITHGLDKAVNWFSLVQDTWRKKTIEEGRLYRCNLYCGKN